MLTIIIAGSVVVLACWLMLAHFSTAVRCEFQKEIERLSATVRALEETSAQRGSETAASPHVEEHALEIVTSKAADAADVRLLSGPEFTTIPVEAEAAITATISACVGQKVQVRSVKLFESADTTTSWVMLGRKAVQSSHNLRASRN